MLVVADTNCSIVFFVVNCPFVSFKPPKVSVQHFKRCSTFSGAVISKLQLVTSQVALKVLVYTVEIFGPESSIEILNRPLAGVGVFLRYLNHEPLLDKTS